jgi:hypothetical protein
MVAAEETSRGLNTNVISAGTELERQERDKSRSDNDEWKCLQERKGRLDKNVECLQLVFDATNTPNNTCNLMEQNQIV